MNSSHYDSATFYDLIHSSNSDYWLASRCVTISSVYAAFGISCVWGNTIDGSALYESDQFNFNGAYCLRPVVSLNSNIKIGDGDGSSPSSAYKIIN